ncbi:OsmC family protein [Halomonas urumqiensis]|uniref:OsmC family peroxiredoxin n=1 Tax=Halomonas urumqiensis TaxID=1684789 RepID=A0A2N7UDA0_9GAMM|nr:OsmC family protein [Halomonas urumqiensis]PMR78400.1 OsmC family peroxiredoxin [Halomonas urumqiensis]PTB03546.1 OsmC family peroxiredoxin [Halomonas urumqiensis]GHE20254.1 osmotically inducible protein OsmC [Halomonas urumqiensis]
MSITKTASARWQGGLKNGKGTVSSESGVLKDTPYDFRQRFEGEAGTNPEELIGAAHASCFSMALSMILGEADMEAESIDTTATVTLAQDDSGFSIPAIHLVTRVKMPGADKAAFEECAEKAKAGCPISKLFNAEITLEATLES